MYTTLSLTVPLLLNIHPYCPIALADMLSKSMGRGVEKLEAFQMINK